MRWRKRVQRPRTLTPVFCPTCATDRIVRYGRCSRCKLRIVPARSKYNSRATRCRQGKTHPSALEAGRCDDLHTLQGLGEISQLEAHPQPLYRLDVNGLHVADYRPDFRYLDSGGRTVVEDTKGWITDVYRLKARLMEAIHGIRILETRKR